MLFMQCSCSIFCESLFKGTVHLLTLHKFEVMTKQHFHSCCIKEFIFSCALQIGLGILIVDCRKFRKACPRETPYYVGGELTLSQSSNPHSEYQVVTHNLPTTLCYFYSQWMPIRELKLTNFASSQKNHLKYSRVHKKIEREAWSFEGPPIQPHWAINL